MNSKIKYYTTIVYGKREHVCVRNDHAFGNKTFVQRFWSRGSYDLWEPWKYIATVTVAMNSAYKDI